MPANAKNQTQSHTPGPWSRVIAPTQIVAGPKIIANINHKLVPEADANARLIAAAPEMLAALRLILASGPLANGMRDDAAMEQAREAVAKALGEA